MADDSDNKDNSREREESRDSSNYVRKNNLIKGVDNDHLIIGLLTGLGLVTAAPYIKQLIDNFMRNMPQGQQFVPQQPPPNGGGQPQLYQPVPSPPPVTNNTAQQAQQEKLIPAPSADVMNPLQEHERRLQEQQNYQAALEKESVQGSQSISMVPDRAKKERKEKDNTYVAGQNVSAGY